MQAGAQHAVAGLSRGGGETLANVQCQRAPFAPLLAILLMALSARHCPGDALRPLPLAAGARGRRRHAAMPLRPWRRLSLTRDAPPAAPLSPCTTFS